MSLTGVAVTSSTEGLLKGAWATYELLNTKEVSSTGKYPPFLYTLREGRGLAQLMHGRVCYYTLLGSLVNPLRAAS